MNSYQQFEVAYPVTVVGMDVENVMYDDDDDNCSEAVHAHTVPQEHGIDDDRDEENYEEDEDDDEVIMYSDSRGDTTGYVSDVSSLEQEGPSILSIEDAALHLQAMKRQEERTYYRRNADYLLVPTTSNNAAVLVDAECRSKMAIWCFQVTEFCGFNRETVGVAMSLLDRFMGVEGKVKEVAEAKQSRHIFQLVAMTCLYIAVKLNERPVMGADVFSGLSRGTYSVENITTMERAILTALEWNVHPPTASTFVDYMVSVLPHPVFRRAVRDEARRLVELALLDYALVGVRSSTIAVAAVLNALNGPSTVGWSSFERCSYLRNLIRSTQINFLTEEVQSVQQHLMGMDVLGGGASGDLAGVVSALSQQQQQVPCVVRDSSSELNHFACGCYASSTSPRTVIDTSAPAVR